MSTRDKTTLLGWFAITAITMSCRYPLISLLGEQAMAGIAMILGITGILLAADIAAGHRRE